MKSMTQKNSLRQYYRQQRKILSPAQQLKAATQLAEHCQGLEDLTQARNIALYLANDGELDTSELIQLCWKLGKQVFLPILHPFCAGHLIFVRYSPDSIMKANLYGIAEPVLRCQDICPVPELDLVFAPLVAFDPKGNRLGMGGGFYDRTLLPIYRDSLNTRVIGLAHQCQKADHLPEESWDLPLNHIIAI